MIIHIYDKNMSTVLYFGVNNLTKISYNIRQNMIEFIRRKGNKCLD